MGSEREVSATFALRVCLSSHVINGRLPGARLAQITGAGVILLAVVETVSGNALAQGADAGALVHQQADFKVILDEGH